MPVSYKAGSTRANSHPVPGTMMRETGEPLDATATLEAILAHLVQVVTNTGGDDPVNLETIMQAVQDACEAILGVNTESRDHLATLIAIQDVIRSLTEQIRNSSAASATDLAALEVINTAIQVATEATQAAVEIIDDTVGTHDDAVPDSVLMQGQYAEETTPAAVADGDTVRPWYDLYGRMIQLFTNLAQSSADVTDVAPAQMQVLIETGWAALTAPAAETPTLDVRDYENITVEYIIATIDTSVDLIIWGSLDNVTWFPMSAFTVLAADDQDDSVAFSGVKVAYLKCEFDAEVGGVAATVTFKVMCGN